ncbi:MAG: thioredoxin family protein [Gemmataceae bacterium]|nr:thioredoxin family protein [Gemmataceae bacterium]
MAKSSSKTARALLTVSLLGCACLLGLAARATELQQAGNQDVQQVLDKYAALRPADKDLAIFQLDWVSTLKEAREKAAREQRPILLIVVTNSYGNMYTGHC